VAATSLLFSEVDAAAAEAALYVERANAAVSALTRRTLVVRVIWIISVPVSLASVLDAIDTGVIAIAQSVSESTRSRTQTENHMTANIC
jgi:hypothetical protein